MTLTRKRKATFVSEKENDETCNCFLKSAIGEGQSLLQVMIGNR